MAEPERIPPSHVGRGRTDQVLSQQRAQQILRAERLGDQRSHGVQLEDLTDDGRGLAHEPLVAREPVETRGEQRGDRGRHLDGPEVHRPLVLLLDQHLDQHAVIQQHLEHLLHEQGIALRRGTDALADLGREGRVTQEVLDERVRLRLRQRLEVDARRVPFASTPSRPLLQQLRSGHAQQRDRCVAGPVSSVLDHVQQGRLRPMDVVEHSDDPGV